MSALLFRSVVEGLSGRHAPLLGQQAETAFGLPVELLAGIVIGLLAAVLAVIVWRRFLLRLPASAADELKIERIDVSNLGDLGPSSGGVHLEFYHVPVRLALLVLAPVGREGKLPASDQLPELIDQLVPGLMRALTVDQPQFRRWPPQLSSEGFTQAFFGHVHLPGDHGKGTPWCSIAGKFEADGDQFLVGLICRAAERNSLGQITVEHSGKWLDVLRVRTGSA